jgi:dethiobiotin synthetase
MGVTFFITGTDTNIGKTYITIGLLKKFKSLGMKSIGIKPIATGCKFKNGIFYNDDALLLQKNSTQQPPYKQINPFSLVKATSPNIAASYENISLTISELRKIISDLYINNVDYLFIEGIGGWEVPLNDQETIADLVSSLKIPTILVIGLKLGCLNHAILTYKNMMSNSLPWIGMIGNCCDSSMEYIDDYIKTLKNFINIPYLGTVQYNEQPENVLDIGPLLNFKHLLDCLVDTNVFSQ